MLLGTRIVCGLRLHLRGILPDFRRYQSIVGSLFPSCNTCGIALQNVDSTKPGYYYLADGKKRPPLIKHSDKVFQESLRLLDDADRALLLNDELPTKSPTHSLATILVAPLQAAPPTRLHSISCIRCRNAIYRQKFDPHEHPVDSMESVLARIDPLGSIVHVVNAFDFPLSVHPSVFKLHSPRAIKVVVTKCDLLFAHSKTSNNYGLQFFRDYFGRKYGVLPKNVFVSSGILDWNVAELLQEIPSDAYLIGDVNVGKSTLIKLLMYGDQKFARKFKSQRQRTQSEKEEDMLINTGASVKTTFADKRQQRRLETQFKATNGPGVLYMPAFTRDVIRWDLPHTLKTVFDVPGIDDEEHGLLQWAKDPAAVRQLVVGTKVHKTGAYDLKYFTLRAGSTCTFGGLLYLGVPLTTMVQVKNSLNVEEMVFRDIERACLVVALAETNRAIAHKVLVKPELTANLVKYVFPPFHGTVDLVIKGIGHINIKPVGPLPHENVQPFTVHLPRGTEAVLRRPISKYISKTLVGRDKRGNPLQKKDWITKGKKEVARYTGGKFYSRLVPVTEDVTLLREFSIDYCAAINGVSHPADNLENLLQNYWIED